MNIRKLIDENFAGPEQSKLRAAVHAAAKRGSGAILGLQSDFYPLTTRQLNRLGEVQKELYLREKLAEQDRW